MDKDFKFLYLTKVEVLMPHLCFEQGTPQKQEPAAAPPEEIALPSNVTAAGENKDLCGVPCPKHRCGIRISIFVKYKNFCPKVLIFCIKSTVTAT